jgi:hypothetical protein
MLMRVTDLFAFTAALVAMILLACSFTPALDNPAAPQTITSTD